MPRRLFMMLLLIVTALPSTAQNLTVATVTRPPFSMVEEGQDTGFSIDLWRDIAAELGRDFEIERLDSFQDMLARVADGSVDLAIANISITASREEIMDFTHPIYASGLQIMTPASATSGGTIMRTVLSPGFLGAVAAAFALLFLGGMLMWRLERRSQPYFDLPARQAMFPAFWWALNLVVNGGFEERTPRTFFGRVFAVFLVVASLFVVSVFVARITAALTVEAIQTTVHSVNDLYGKRVGTIAGSTAADYMDARDLRYRGFAGLDELIEGFEAGELDAVVFDAPILAYYVLNSEGAAVLAGPVFLRENYGIALPSGSSLAEPINQALLRLRENGAYETIRRKWFGGGG